MQEEEWDINFSESWIEIYFTMDTENYIRAKDILSHNGIVYRDTSIDNQNRLSLNNLFARNMILSRNTSVKNHYRLEVKKKDEYLSRKLLANL